VTSTDADRRFSAITRTAAQTRVLDAALKLIAERGVSGTSLQMIADEMGVTKAAVYYHFHAKVDILRALVEPVHERLNELLDAVEAKRARRDRIETLAAGIADIGIAQRALVGIAANDPALRVRLKGEAARFDALNERTVHALYGPHPTNDERAAAYLGSGLPEAVARLSDLDDETLRATLRRSYIRILTVRT